MCTFLRISFFNIKTQKQEIVINKVEKMMNEEVYQDTMYPVIRNGKQILREHSHRKAQELYGVTLPEEVEDRLNKELSIICSQDYEAFYLIEKELIEKSGLKKGHSLRGLGSNSFVAYLCGISVINPLSPHYRCKEGHYSEFFSSDEANTIGAVLPDKICPVCGKPLKGDGYDLPFEFFIHNRSPPF